MKGGGGADQYYAQTDAIAPVFHARFPGEPVEDAAAHLLRNTASIVRNREVQLVPPAGQLCLDGTALTGEFSGVGNHI